MSCGGGRKKIGSTTRIRRLEQSFGLSPLQVWGYHAGQLFICGIHSSRIRSGILAAGMTLLPHKQSMCGFGSCQAQSLALPWCGALEILLRDRQTDRQSEVSPRHWCNTESHVCVYCPVTAKGRAGLWAWWCCTKDTCTIALRTVLPSQTKTSGVKRTRLQL